MKSQNKFLALIMALVMLLTLMPIATLSTSAEEPTFNYVVLDTAALLNSYNSSFKISYPDGTVCTFPLELGDVVITDNRSLNVQNLVIPSTIDGHPVRAIHNRAFSENSYIETLVIPSSVRYIGQLAFYSCSNLEKIECSAEALGSRAFAVVDKLESLVLKEGVKHLAPQAFYAYSMALAPQNLVAELPEGLEAISANALFRITFKEIYFYGKNLSFKESSSVRPRIDAKVAYGHIDSDYEAFAKTADSGIIKFIPFCTHDARTGATWSYEGHGAAGHECTGCELFAAHSYNSKHTCIDCGYCLPCTDSNHDLKCDTCGKELEKHEVDHTFFCKMCPMYFAHRDTAIIGPFIRFIHNFVHMAHFIGYIT